MTEPTKPDTPTTSQPLRPRTPARPAAPPVRPPGAVPRMPPVTTGPVVGPIIKVPDPINPNILRDLLTSIETAKSCLKFYLVLEEDAEPIRVKVFDTREDLVSELRVLNEKPKPGMRVLIFQGSRLFLSKGPYRYLLAGTEKIPLFVVPSDVEPDEDGYLVPDPKVEILPPQSDEDEGPDKEDGEVEWETPNDLNAPIDDVSDDPIR